jgi:oligopeptide/dipeptide ABC transporter ATP-binding protein
MSEPLLQVENLAVEIDGQRALHDVVLAVPPGGCVGIVGETGSGKSLTCRAILGLLPRIGARVVDGTATFDGLDILTLPERGWRDLRGRRVALIPQTSLTSLDPVMRVGKQMAETIRKFDGGSNPARCIELLDAVEMPDPVGVMKCYPHELSGGMRQRIMIALALAGRPALLVADEASTALDVTIQRAILELLDRLRVELGMALLMVTHDIGVVQTFCDSVAVMYAGATVEHGPTREVCATPAHPYTHALMAAEPSLSAGSDRLATLPGAPPELGAQPDGCAFAPRCTYARDICKGGRLSLDMVSDDHAVACRRVGEVLR